MGRRPSLTNGCLVVHMQSYTRLHTNLTRTKILMKTLLMMSAGFEKSWEWSPFMIAVKTIEVHALQVTYPLSKF